MLFFLPWAYLVARMSNKRPSHVMVRLAYILVFGVWLVGPGIGGLFVLVLYINGVEGKETILSSPFVVGFAILLNFVTWGVSLERLLSANEYSSRYPHTVSDGLLPPAVYLMPFGLATLWHVIVYSMAWW